MLSRSNLLGLVLIIIGIVSLVYQGITYTKQENVAQIGDIKLTAQTQETISIPPIVGGLALVAGIVVIALGRRK